MSTRLLLAVVGAVLTVGSAGWLRVSSNDRTFQLSAAAAAQQFNQAQIAMGVIQAARVESVNRFALELSQQLGGQELQHLPEAVKRTTFGDVGPGVMVVNRLGKMTWASGGEAKETLAFAALSAVLGGEELRMALVKPGQPLAAQLVPPAVDWPVLVTVVPLRNGKDTVGAVVATDPLGLSFFQSVGQLTGVRVAIVSDAVSWGNAPAETHSVGNGPPVLIGKLWAARVPFRIPPGFLVGDVVVATEARHTQVGSDLVAFVGIVAGVLLLMGAALKRS